MTAHRPDPLWRFLGEPTIPGPEGDLAIGLSRKSVALLAYLALHPGGVSRDEAASLLWPDAGPAKAKHSLRQCLVDLRKAFGEEAAEILSISEQRLALRDGKVAIDAVRLFELAADETPQAEELLGLCRGPFLQGFTAHAQPFGDWAAAQRSSLASTAGQALARALAQAEQAGRRAEAARISAVLAELQAHLGLILAPETLPAAPQPPRRATPRRWRRTALLTGSATLLAGASLFGAYQLSHPVRNAIDGMIVAVYPGWHPGPPSIAVMPFTARTPSPEAAILAGGLTSGVTYALYAVTANELFVVTAVWDAQELRGKSVPEIARILDVRYLMSGQVSVEGDVAEVAVQLLDGETGKIIDSDNVVEQIREISRLEDAVTFKIIRGLDIELSRTEENRIKLIDDTQSLDAWIEATKGLSRLIKVTRHDVEAAEAHYDKALAFDPEYIGALRGRVWSEFLRGRLGWKDVGAAIAETDLRMQEVWKRKPDDATTRSLHGQVLLLKGDHAGAVAEGERAVEDLPGSADVHALYAHTLTFAGEPEKALDQIDLAMRLSPMHPPWYRWVKGRALRLTGRPHDAIAALEAGRDPDRPVVVQLVELAASYTAAGRPQDAKRIAREILKVMGNFTATVWLDHPRPVQAVYQRELDLLVRAGLPR